MIATDLRALITTLRNDFPADYWLAAATLAQSGEDFALNLLLVALDAPEESRRTAAAFALGRIHDSRAIPGLVQILRSRDRRVREYAVELILAFRQECVEPMIASLRDSDADVRSRAADILGRFGGLRAIEPLTEAMHDADGWVRIAAALSLLSIVNRRSLKVGGEANTAGLLTTANLVEFILENLRAKRDSRFASPDI